MERKALPIFYIFLVSGFGDAAGALVGYARESFHLTATQAGLIPVCGFLSFGLCSLPGGLLAARKGGRFLLLLGLTIVTAAYALPSLHLDRFGEFLALLLAVGVGMTLLQVASNPLMRDVSLEGRYARNLTFAQFVKSVGSIAGPGLLALIAARGRDWREVFGIFAVLSAAGLLWAWAAVKGSAGEGARPAPPRLRDSLALLRDPAVGCAALGVSLYVGAEVGLSAWLATYLCASYGMPLGTEATRLGPGLFFTALCAGRLLGSMALNFMPARRFFLLCAVGGLVGVAGLVLSPARGMAVASVVMCGLCFGNVWPLIFSLVVERMPTRSAELSGLLCTAIVGGALLPLVMGFLGDQTSIRWSFVVPMGSFIYLTGLALAQLDRQANRGRGPGRV